LAILSAGKWRTPLGDARIAEDLAKRVCAACPALREDQVAHRSEHSLEVQLPFLQALDPDFTFVPIAVGTIRFPELVNVGEGLARVLAESGEDILVVTSSDMNHYEDDETTRNKDQAAIDRMLELDPTGLYEVCLARRITMCGLGPAVAMLTAMRLLGAENAQLVRYATSAEVSGDRTTVVGYAGMTFG
jgi:AmmeMemoRadiSam system protein B